MTDHYNQYESNFNNRETIETWEALGHGFGACLCTAIKYMDRAGKKPGNSETGDMEKACWYMERALFKNRPKDMPGGEYTMLDNCRISLADFNLRMARRYMQIYIDAVQFR